MIAAPGVGVPAVSAAAVGVPGGAAPGIAGSARLIAAPRATGTLAPSRRSIPSRRLGTPPPNATVVHRSDLGPTMARFALAPDAGLPPFRPGQYFAIGLELDGRLVQRPYSAASSSAERWLDVAIRLVRGGALTPALWRLHPGDRVRIGPPKGLFGLSDGDPRTHLLLATGTGIAPLVAMARALHANASPPRTIVVHGVARAEELAYATELEAWAGSREEWCYVPAISRPADPANAGWSGRVGRLDAVVPQVLDDLRVDLANAVAYACGNPEMIAGLERRLADLGLPGGAFRSEAY